MKAKSYRLLARRKRIKKVSARVMSIINRRQPVERQVWADLVGCFPDGICLDAENAIWYADVPNKRCVGVREGGEVLQSIDLSMLTFK